MLFIDLTPNESQDLVYDETLSFGKTPISVPKDIKKRSNIVRISGNQVQINLPTGEQGYISIGDLQGRIISQHTISSSETVSLKTLGSFSQGVYLLRVTSKSSAAVYKVTIR